MSLLFFRICSFSSRQSWQSFAPARLGLVLLIISYFKSGSGFSFIFQMCEAKAVECFFSLSLKLCLCTARRDLKSLSVIPM